MTPFCEKHQRFFDMQDGHGSCSECYIDKLVEDISDDITKLTDPAHSDCTKAFRSAINIIKVYRIVIADLEKRLHEVTKPVTNTVQ